MTASRSETRPCTTFANGINPFNPTQPEPVMQIPAKPAKTRLKDADYSTPYQPRAAAPVKPPAPVALPDIDDVVIEDGVALPPRGKPRRCWAPLLHKLKAGQSAVLPIRAKAVLSKDITEAHKAKVGKFVTKLYPDSGQLRVWRAA